MRQSVATKPLKKMAERVESGNEEEFAEKESLIFLWTKFLYSQKKIKFTFRYPVQINEQHNQSKKRTKFGKK